MTDMPLKLVVFDCDGTLVDSQHNIITCMREAFTYKGLEAPGDAAIRSIIGLNLDQAIHSLMNEKDDETLLLSLVDAYKNAFMTQRLQPDHHEPLYDGTLDILIALEEAGTPMAVATGKSMRGLKAIIEQHNLERFFMSLQTPDSNPGKPHPQMLEKAMSAVGAEAANTFMIGDTSYDISMAKNAGCHAVGVNWGYHDEETLWQSGADHLIHHYRDLYSLIHP
jgi:phosphoglycolate phosphatase